MNRKTLLIAAAAGSLLTGCLGNGDDAPGPQTVTQIAASQIAAATDETSTPIVLNDLPISDAGTDDTSEPVGIN